MSKKILEFELRRWILVTLCMIALLSLSFYTDWVPIKAAIEVMLTWSVIMVIWAIWLLSKGGDDTPEK